MSIPKNGTARKSILDALMGDDDESVTQPEPKPTPKVTSVRELMYGEPDEPEAIQRAEIRAQNSSGVAVKAGSTDYATLALGLVLTDSYLYWSANDKYYRWHKKNKYSLIRNIDPVLAGWLYDQDLDSSITPTRELKHMLQTFANYDGEPPAWIRESKNGWDPADIFAFADKLLHVPTGEVIPGTPGYFNLYCTTYDYDPNASCPRWLNLLHEHYWPGDPDSPNTLCDYAGYLVSGDTSLHKMLLIQGPPRCGKGVIARTLMRMLEHGTSVRTNLSKLNGEFGLHPLFCKKLAVIAETKNDSKSTMQLALERLLELAGGDNEDQSVDRKNRDDLVADINTRFMLTFNNLPNLRETSGALAARVIMLKMTHDYLGREDSTLERSLIAELPGIFNWAMEGYRRLKKRGHFIQPASGASLKEDMAELSSPISVFIRDWCDIGEGHSVPVQTLYRAWTAWCDQNGQRPNSPQVFGSHLRAAVPQVESVRPRLLDGSRQRLYQGIRLATRADAMIYG